MDAAVARSARCPTGADPAATSRAWYDELRLAPVVADGLRDRGLDEAAAWSVADLVRVLLDLPRPGTLRGAAKTLDARLLDAWLARDDLRAAIGVNTWEGTDWLDRDRFAAMLRWAARLDAVEAGKAPPTRLPPYVKRLTEAAATAGYRVDRLRELLAPTPVATKAAGQEAARKPTPRRPRAVALTHDRHRSDDSRASARRGDIDVIRQIGHDRRSAVSVTGRVGGRRLAADRQVATVSTCIDIDRR